MAARMVSVDGELADETPLAWKFVPHGCSIDDAVWCPKSICEWEDDGDGDTSTEGTMSVPIWFAKKEGLE